MLTKAVYLTLTFPQVLKNTVVSSVSIEHRSSFIHSAPQPNSIGWEMSLLRQSGVTYLLTQSNFCLKTKERKKNKTMFFLEI